MKIIRTFGSVLVVSAAALLTGCGGGAGSEEATGEPVVGEAASAFSGWASAPGGLLNARFGPGAQYGIAYQIPSGQLLNINCYALGSFYAGSNYWYQLWDGTYVTTVGANAGPGIPQCGGFGFGPNPGFGGSGPRR